MCPGLSCCKKLCFQSTDIVFFINSWGKKKKKAYTTFYVTEFTEEWGFRRRLEEYLTQNRGRRAPSGPRAPVLGHTITTWSERTAGSLIIPPNLKFPTSRSIKSRRRKVSSRRRKKGHNLDEWNWAKDTRSQEDFRWSQKKRSQRYFRLFV